MTRFAMMQTRNNLSCTTVLLFVCKDWNAEKHRNKILIFKTLFKKDEKKQQEKHCEKCSTHMFEKSILRHKSAYSTLISTQPSSCFITLTWWSGWDQTSACHTVITALHMRRRRNSTVCASIHGAERQRSCWSHDCGTVLAGVGGAISRAIWVNRSRLLLRHEASPPDSALLTLGRFCGHTQTDGTYAARLKPALGLESRSGQNTDSSWPRLKPICSSRLKFWKFQILSFSYNLPTIFTLWKKTSVGFACLRVLMGARRDTFCVKTSRLLFSFMCLFIALVLAIIYPFICPPFCLPFILMGAANVKI